MKLLRKYFFKITVILAVVLCLVGCRAEVTKNENIPTETILETVDVPNEEIEEYTETLEKTAEEKVEIIEKRKRFMKNRLALCQ